MPRDPALPPQRSERFAVTRTRIKICGLTSASDAAAAVAAGADAVGVVLAPSPREVSIDQACRVLAGVPAFVTRVGVFVDAAPEFVARAVARVGLDAVQFHGDESPERCASAPWPVLKAFRVGTVFDTDTVEPYRGLVDAVLLDTYDPQQHGGTGKTFSWHIACEFPGWAPVLLAGGLTPDNVGAAVRQVHPFAVDVSSGVESAPGIKDHDKIEAFARAVREADAEGGAS